MGYVRPVDPVDGRMSTYRAHTRRVPPSSEAGVDYYCPIGTPIRAAGPGRVVVIGGGTLPATGRYVTIDLDDGRRVRYLHLSRWNASIGQRVTKGTIVGYSGASGYGSEYFGADSLRNIPANTGGPHVHWTLWPTHENVYGRYPLEPTLDGELYVDKASTADDDSKPFTPTPLEEDMRIIDAAGRGFALVGAGYFRSLTGPEGAALTKVLTSKTVSATDFDLIRTACTAGDTNYMPPVRTPNVATDVWAHPVNGPGDVHAAAMLTQTRNGVRHLEAAHE